MGALIHTIARKSNRAEYKVASGPNETHRADYAISANFLLLRAVSFVVLALGVSLGRHMASDNYRSIQHIR